MVRNGSRSWIGVGAFSIQPSEFMKLAMIAFLAKFLSEKQKNITSFRRGFVPALGIVFSAFIIIMCQPDLGTGTVMVGTCIVMIFVSGARIAHFAFLGLIGLSGFAALVLSAPYRIKRITSYLNPWEDPLGSGFQIIQSLYAVGPGGLFGMGLGQSRQKFFTCRSRKPISFLLFYLRNSALSAVRSYCCCSVFYYGGASGLPSARRIYTEALSPSVLFL